MNVIKPSPTLAQIVMPLVGLMARGGLSWSDCDRISQAIATCVVQWDSMQAECSQTSQINAQAAYAQAKAEQ
jgi:hypothetical protein